ncbi:hypothetical protein AB833_17255 [Chromatiales bacterium (ex Bugula neritina AB1)]|nr:hypothetical protein AB833_17255 [Chromatiales bacterium (ex Bugula neritina AB1)]
MFYLISQLLLLLAIASLLSGAIGWLCRRFISDNAHSEEIRKHQRAGRRQVAEIDDLRRELTDRNSQVDGLRAHLEENQQHLDLAEDEREQLLDDLHHLRGLENDYRAIVEDLARIDKERADAEEALEKARKEATEKEQLLLQSGQEARQAEEISAQQLMAAESATANLEGIIASLNNDLDNKTAAAEAANRKQAELADEISKLQSKLSDAEKSSAQTIGGLNKSLRDEKDKLSAAKELIASGEQKLKGIDALLTERTKERDKLENLAESKQKEIAALQKEINRLQNEAAEARTNNHKVVADLEHALDKQATLAADANKQIVNETKVQDQLKNEIGSLQRELKDAAAAADQRSAKAAEVLEQQKLATVAADSAKVGLDNELQELRRQYGDLKNSAGKTSDRLHASDKEAAKLAEKNANAELKITDLEAQLRKSEAQADVNNKRFQREMNSKDQLLQGKSDELADALAQIQGLQERVGEFESSDAELRSMIENLQALLSEERRLAGQSLLARIKELEAMLEAERRKADDLREIPAVSNISWRSDSVTHASAANTANVNDKKTGTGQK